MDMDEVKEAVIRMIGGVRKFKAVEPFVSFEERSETQHMEHMA